MYTLDAYRIILVLLTVYTIQTTIGSAVAESFIKAT